ncbi:MAG: tetratricopeptide repeat protein [Deltaproteobacteria bacterium]|nr:tetratricopeptide repeat protein [Deltaproteobacteria bacterium]
MIGNRHRSWSGKYGISFTLLFVLVLMVYSNTFHAAWQFDDFPNIVRNSRLHLSDLRPQSLARVLSASSELDRDQAIKIYRPVVYLTFALNWYVGKDKVAGYHMVNLGVHLLTAFVLYAVILSLIQLPALKNRYAGSEHFIALLASVLWALHPIQTQAVTYIVQRMTSMATLFYVLGLYFYLKGRARPSSPLSIVFFVATGFSFALAFGSKENAITFPISLLLIELVLFRQSGGHIQHKRFLWAGAGIILVVCGLGYVLAGADLPAFLNEYEHRPFTLLQRLMTQPRVILLYLTQIVYPIPNRLSIVHDIVTSKSLWQPWTTLPAIFLVFSMIAAGILQLKDRPLLALGVLFFFINHVVESSIIPLEMAFEHRNYLPTIFLFCPVAAGIKQLMDYYKNKNLSMYAMMAGFVALLIIGFGVGTYSRNMSWISERSLWEDVLVKYPRIARPYQQLAVYYKGTGDLKTASALYKKAMTLKDPRPRQSRALSLNNLAIMLQEQGAFEKAVTLYKNALTSYPEYIYAHYNMVLALINTNQLNEALRNIDYLISKNPHQEEYLNIGGFILIKKKQYAAAVPYLRKALRLAPSHRGVLANLGFTFSRLGKHKKAEWFLKLAHQANPKDPIILLTLLENSLRGGNRSEVDRYLERLFKLVSIEDVRLLLRGLPRQGLALPLSPELLGPAIAEKLDRYSERILRNGIK